MKVKEFLKKNGVVIAIAIVAVLFITYSSCSQSALFKNEMRAFKAEVKGLQVSIDKGFENIKALEQKLDEIDKKLAEYDDAIKAGEVQYQTLLNEITTRLKPDANPEVFSDLEKCQENYDLLFKDFKLTLAALKKGEENFALSIGKNKVLEEKVTLLEKTNEEWQGIAAGYKSQYDAAVDTLNRLGKKLKFKAAAGSVLDATAILGGMYFARKGKWDKALTTVAVRYVFKLLLKV